MHINKPDLNKALPPVQLFDFHNIKSTNPPHFHTLFPALEGDCYFNTKALAHKHIQTQKGQLHLKLKLQCAFCIDKQLNKNEPIPVQTNNI